jgi:hypothetical protein
VEQNRQRPGGPGPSEVASVWRAACLLASAIEGREFNGFAARIGLKGERMIGRDLGQTGGNGMDENQDGQRSLLADSPLPLIYRWNQESKRLPCRSVRMPNRHGRFQPQALDAPPWHQSGPLDQPFDFCRHMARLCSDVVSRCPEFHHIDVNRLIIATTQARTGRRSGLQARVTPLRFRYGKMTRKRRGHTYQIQRFFVDDREILYLVTFCLPRFLDQDFDEKFVTLFHELYHISPEFDGDLRRHPGRCAMHTHSKNAYDKHMAHLARLYLASGADPSLHGFLRLNFNQLHHRHGSVMGVVVPRPLLIPIQGVR